MIIISGTGRSGTTFIHAVLTELGLDMGRHEKYPGKDGAVGGYRVLKKLGKGRLITQLRQPLDTITSSQGSPNLIDYPELGIRRKDYTEAEYLSACWYAMNTYLIERSVFVYTLECLNEGRVSAQLIQLFGLSCTEDAFNAVIERVRETNKMNRRPKQAAPNLRNDKFMHLNQMIYDKYRSRNLH